MKKIILFFVAIIFSVNGFSQAPAIQWQKCLGGTAEDYASSIQQTADGGYIVTGNTWSNNGDVTGNHGGDFWIVKLDSSGTLQWQKCLGGTGIDYSYSIQQTADNGFIVAGFTTSNDGDVIGYHGNTDYWVVKLSSSGTLQWQKCLGGTADDVAFSIQQTAEGGYIVGGYTESNNGDVTGNHGNTDFWIVKLDSSGTIQWQKCFGGTGVDDAFSIQQTTGGDYIVIGRTYSTDGDVTGNHGIGDYWIVKLDGGGNLQWQKCLGGTNIDEAYSIQQTSDAGYIVAGYTKSNDGDVTGNHGIGDYWIVKLDGGGNLQWQKCLGGTNNDEAHSIQQTDDGGYIVEGRTSSTDGDVTGNHSFYDYWVVKLDGSGILQWQKCLGGTSDDYARSIQQTTDGGYIVAGSTNSTDGDITGNHGIDDYWIVKLAPVVGIDELTGGENLISLFPNPATSELVVRSSEFGEINEIEIYNVLGEKRLILNPSPRGEGLRVDVSSLPAGVYFVAVTDDKGNKITRRFVKM